MRTDGSEHESLRSILRCGRTRTFPLISDDNGVKKQAGGRIPLLNWGFVPYFDATAFASPIQC